MNKFLPIFLFFVFWNISVAQTTPITTTSAYSGSTLLDLARKNCQNVIEKKNPVSIFSGVDIPYTEPSPISVDGNVVRISTKALTDAANKQIKLLEFISALLFNRNFSEDCAKNIAAANAIQAVTKDLETTQKRCADNDCDNPEKVAQQVANREIAQEAARQQNSSHPQKEAGLFAISSILKPRKEIQFKYTAAEIDDFTSGRRPMTSDALREIALGNNFEDFAAKTANRAVLNSITAGGEVLSRADKAGGVVPAARCTKTYSGADPENIKFTDPDCVPSSVRYDPTIVTQEKIKQLINAPYNQAFSQSAVYGTDGGLQNIAQRIQTGKLFEKGIGKNFGDQNTNYDSTSNASSTYAALINNIDLAIEIERAIITLHASSSSPCVFTPINDRNNTISQSATKIIEYTAAKNEIDRQWQYIQANSSKDNTAIILNLSAQLSQKWNKDFILGLIEKFKEKAQVCIDAKDASTAP